MAVSQFDHSVLSTDLLLNILDSMAQCKRKMDEGTVPAKAWEMESQPASLSGSVVNSTDTPQKKLKTDGGMVLYETPLPTGLQDLPVEVFLQVNMSLTTV